MIFVFFGAIIATIAEYFILCYDYKKKRKVLMIAYWFFSVVALILSFYGLYKTI